jgi:hypothetical protein
MEAGRDEEGDGMKIIATVSDGNGAVHIGLPVEHRSAIIEIPDDNVPKLVPDYFEAKMEARERSARGENFFDCSTLTFSILEGRP